MAELGDEQGEEQGQPHARDAAAPKVKVFAKVYEDEESSGDDHEGDKQNADDDDGDAEDPANKRKALLKQLEQLRERRVRPVVASSF